MKAAIVMQKTGLRYAKALARLRKAHDSMREAIGEDIEPRLRGLLQGLPRLPRSRMTAKNGETPSRKTRRS